MAPKCYLGFIFIRAKVEKIFSSLQLITKVFFDPLRPPEAEAVAASVPTNMSPALYNANWNRLHWEFFHSVSHSLLHSSVWADVEIKTSLNFIKSCNRSFYLKGCFSKKFKKSIFIWANWVKNTSPRTGKYRPIWSHWLQTHSLSLYLNCVLYVSHSVRPDV